MSGAREEERAEEEGDERVRATENNAPVLVEREAEHLALGVERARDGGAHAALRVQVLAELVLPELVGVGLGYAELDPDVHAAVLRGRGEGVDLAIEAVELGVEPEDLVPATPEVSELVGVVVAVAV